uniref:Putative secreted protein n=1 Tax=Amblyomma parvum TaxID=251391 RepID=A0A023G2W3_AMBPA
MARILGVLVRLEVDVGHALAAFMAHLDRDVAVAPEQVLQRVAHHRVVDLVAQVGGAEHLVAAVRRAPVHLQPVVVERGNPVRRGVAATATMLGRRLVGAAPVPPIGRPPRAVVVSSHGPLAASARRVPVLFFHPSRTHTTAAAITSPPSLSRSGKTLHKINTQQNTAILVDRLNRASTAAHITKTP